MILKHRIVDTYWANMSFVSAPGCKRRFLLLKKQKSSTFTQTNGQLYALTRLVETVPASCAHQCAPDSPVTSINTITAHRKNSTSLDVFQCTIGLWIVDDNIKYLSHT